jgi:hypothetical protein
LLQFLWRLVTVAQEHILHRLSIYYKTGWEIGEKSLEQGASLNLPYDVERMVFWHSKRPRFDCLSSTSISPLTNGIVSSITVFPLNVCLQAQTRTYYLRQIYSLSLNSLLVALASEKRLRNQRHSSHWNMPNSCTLVDRLQTM